MKVLANDLQRQYELYSTEFEEKALKVLRKGWYVLGEEVSSFEDEFAQALHVQHCVGLASGLDALWIAFKLLGIGHGDEVIVASNAYIACVMGITIAGATPVFVEPDEYENIDANKISEKITSKTKAILAVHMFGQPCNMTKVMEIAKEYKLEVVEDCAQSHKSMWDGKYVGTFGAVGCFSFYPTKNLGGFGDGGAIVTNRLDISDACKVFRNYGSRVKYENDVQGTNSRLDELQAGLLRIKLQHLDEMNQERTRLAGYYMENISNPKIHLPKAQKKSDCTWHQFVVHCKERDALQTYLSEHGIGTMIHYPIPPHLSKAYVGLGYQKGDFPIAERAANEVLSLPFFNGMSEKEQEYVAEIINLFGKGE